MALVNNAATSANKPLGEPTLAEWNRVLAVNLTGAMLCAKYAAPYLRRQQGSIINIASTRASDVGSPYRGLLGQAKAGCSLSRMRWR